MLKGPWAANMSTVDELYESRDRWRATGVGSLTAAFLLLVVLLALTAQTGKLELANKELAAAFSKNCSAMHLGDLAWLTMINGEIVCVKTAAVPTREQYLKHLPPKVKL